MAERCRDYPHLLSCEYNSGTSTSLCSCGQGKVGSYPKLLLPEWDTLKPNATRVVISPVFCAPYLENTRGLLDNFTTELVKGGTDRRERYFKAMEPITDKVEKESGRAKCVVCYKATTKKCGRCSIASYCSRECQVEDWKTHKNSCKADDVKFQ